MTQEAAVGRSPGDRKGALFPGAMAGLIATAEAGLSVRAGRA